MRLLRLIKFLHMQFTETLLTTKQAAECLQVTPSTVSAWMHSGKLDCMKIGRRLYTSREAIWRMGKPIAHVKQSPSHEAAMAELRRMGLAK